MIIAERDTGADRATVRSMVGPVETVPKEAAFARPYGTQNTSIPHLSSSELLG